MPRPSTFEQLGILEDYASRGDEGGAERAPGYPAPARSRGRPRGSFRDPSFRELTPLEHRVALMRVAGATLTAIAQFTGSEECHIGDMLARPHVLSFLGFLNATHATSIQPSVAKLNEAIEETATRAFVVARDNMEDLHEMGEDLREENSAAAIRAKLGAVATAQDILDRAGKRAPTRIIGGVVHSVDPTALDHLAGVIEVVAGRVGQGVGKSSHVPATLLEDFKKDSDK